MQTSECLSYITPPCSIHELFAERLLGMRLNNTCVGDSDAQPQKCSCVHNLQQGDTEYAHTNAKFSGPHFSALTYVSSSCAQDRTHHRTSQKAYLVHRRTLIDSSLLSPFHGNRFCWHANGKHTCKKVVLLCIH